MLWCSKEWISIHILWSNRSFQIFNYHFFFFNFAFVTTFFLRLNVRSYIWIINFGVTFKTKFEKSDWGFLLRVGATIVIEKIDAFLLYLWFVPTHNIQCFMQRQDLEKFGTIEVVVNNIYGRFAKTFILVVANGLEDVDT